VQPDGRAVRIASRTINVLGLYLLATELPSRQRSPFGHGLEFRPADRTMANPRTDAAVRPGDHVFTAQEVRVPDQTLDNQLRVLDEIGGMTAHAGHQRFACRTSAKMGHIPGLKQEMYRAVRPSWDRA
jgi:hypothetical protein